MDRIHGPDAIDFFENISGEKYFIMTDKTLTLNIIKKNFNAIN